MSKYTSIIPTITGQSMLAEAISTQQELIFTSIRLGDGVLTESDVPTEFTALKAQKLVADINTFDDSLKAQGKVTLIATIDNSHVDTGFFARELGVFGKVGDEGAEQLFAYCNAGNYADYMPDKTSQLDETQLAVQLAVGATANVTAIINSLQYATLKNIADHDEDEDAHDGILEKVSELLGDIVTHLASDAAIAISSLSTDSVFYRLLQYALNAAGVQYNFQNANAWYICLGALFGGLIIQGGTLSITLNSYDVVHFPITFSSFAKVPGITLDKGCSYDVHTPTYTAEDVTLQEFAIFNAAPTNLSPNATWIAFGV